MSAHASPAAHILSACRQCVQVCLHKACCQLLMAAMQFCSMLLSGIVISRTCHMDVKKILRRAPLVLLSSCSTVGQCNCRCLTVICCGWGG